MGVKYIVKLSERSPIAPPRAAERSEVTEFCWDPRDDGVHFTCEAMPYRNGPYLNGERAYRSVRHILQEEWRLLLVTPVRCSARMKL